MKGEEAREQSPLGQVPPGWRLAQLKDVSTKIGSGATPGGGESVYLPTRLHFALIRSQNVFDRRFESAGLAFISDAHAKELKNATVQPFDILLNITGDGITFARACLAPSSVLPACVNQHVSIVRVDRTAADPGYVLSYLTHPAIKSYVESFNAGGSRRAITKGHIESFQVPLPPLPEQQAIAGFLGALDDKIELNRGMNETLESMARAIFKSWFVDFDPVRAKAAGRQPLGMDASTAALIPDSFQDSPLGKIPKGFQAAELGSVLAELETGSRPKGGVGGYSEGVPSIGAESIVGLAKFDFAKTKYVPHDYYLRMTKGKVKSRDVLLYKDGGKPGVYEPHVAMFGDGFPYQKACINEHVYRMRGREALSQPYLYFWLTSDLAMDEMRQKGTGVAIPGLNSTAVRSLAILVPSEGILRRYEEICEPMILAILNNSNESRTLASIRDVLLPKLISGKIRVKDADRIIRVTK